MLFAFHFGKSMNPFFLGIRKHLDGLGFFVLIWQPVDEKENSEFKSALLRLKKINLVSHFSRAEGLFNTHIGTTRLYNPQSDIVNLD